MKDSNTVIRAYKFRFYPTVAQSRQLAIEFGHSRAVWNMALDARKTTYRLYGESHNNVSLSKAITELKNDVDFEWLKQATNACLQQKLIDLDKAYNDFFARIKQGKKGGFPKFKKRRGRQSVRYSIDERFSTQFEAGEYLKIPKLGNVKLRWTRLPKGRPKMATVSRNPDGRYYVSMSIEESVPLKAKTKRSVGLDVGIKDVLVTSDGHHSGAPKYTYQYARALKLAQRKLSRKTKGSSRWHRQNRAVNRIHSKIARCRLDFLHKESFGLVTDYDVICLEDLNVAGMKKNRKLSKAVSDAGLGELKRQIQYKADWYGKTVSVISRWYPSSKTCSGCGQIHDMPLDKRVMDCDCGVTMCRDLNAAHNILAEGIRSLNVDGDINRSAQSIKAA